ncbi:MafB-related protein [Beggiatoa sp. PS]|nr:MafB-related protein [Beggiatoa sp. PS]
MISKKSGKELGEAGKQYEMDVREKTGGQSEILEEKEIDSVTENALIQAKDSQSAIHKPKNFLNKKTRNQIKTTIKMAQQQHKSAEFWFKLEPHQEVQQYIEQHGGKVIIWSKE